MWLTGLLLVLEVCWAVLRPHGLGGLCTRLAWWAFLSGWVLALQLGGCARRSREALG